MCFDAKLMSAHSELERCGIWKSNFNPPYVRWFRKMGFKLRPFHYNSFTMNLMVSFFGFGVPWSVFMALVVWIPFEIPLADIIIPVLIMTVGYSFSVAIYAEWSRRKNSISKWDDLNSKTQQ